MKDLIANFPQQLLDGISKFSSMNVSKNMHEKYTKVVLIGMGGSGIGGKIVSQWIVDEITIPVSVCQDYTVPATVDAETLVIAVSYSGNTEETLSALSKCKDKNARIVCITSGGEMERLATNNDWLLLSLPTGFPPRAALAYAITSLLSVLTSLGLISGKCLEQLSRISAILTEKQSEMMEEAKAIASKINNTILTVYAESAYEPIATRFKQQLNENSKFPCHYNVIPEMNHNELLGWESADKQYCVIFIKTNDMHPRNEKRMQLTEELLRSKSVNIIRINSTEKSKVENALYLIHVTDWVSYYMAELREVDILEIKWIDLLKYELAEEK